MTRMTRIARIALPVPLHRSFDYAAPEGQPVPALGARVRAPFRNRSLIGICVGLDPPDAHPNPKPLDETLDAESILTGELFALARWLADYYHHPLGEVFAAMLPNSVLKGAPLVWREEAIWRRTALQAEDLGRAPRQRALLQFLEGRSGWASARDIRAAGFSSAMIAALARKRAIEQGERPWKPEPPPPPTAEQQAAIAACKDALGRFSPILLDGVTGSGKTEVYLQAIGEVLRRGGQALVLVPEIALAPQTVERFQRRFGATDVLHSGLADGERLAAWLRCRDDKARILIGTRSAALTPFARLGLIVVDEEHDPSFKQQEGLRYSARDLAVKRARTLNIPVILGSATPSLDSLRNARTGRYRRQRLTRRTTGAQAPALRLLDIRGLRLQDGLSDPLARRIRRHLQAGSQVLAFLNRRGYAPACLCPGCGWQALCQACDARLTLHRSPAELRCHHCGARAPAPAACPECGRAGLLAAGVGTQRIEAGLLARFPGWPLVRIDRDSVRSQRRLGEQLARIRAGGPAILIGTQMLAKGHDFPNVALVAALNADAGFLSADFKAAERTAQLIVQVAGRAGRAERPGEVWIQTLQPENPVLRRLMEAGYAGFAQHELAMRERAGLPPARPMALIRAEAPDPAPASRFLARLKEALPPGLEILGPAPAPMPRLAGRHRQQLMLMADRRRTLHQALAAIAGTEAPRSLRWSIDVDPEDGF